VRDAGATNATLLSMEYGGNEELHRKACFISTALSVFTIPLVTFLLFT
jgi:predicted permease